MAEDVAERRGPFMATEAQAVRLTRHQWAAVIAAILGWTLDAFDFFLMVFMFGAIAKAFHADVAAVAIASTLTLAARPFGAFVFGRLADEYGRRPILIAVILLYSALECASAFAPSLAVLLILRAAFGFAMGGEWGIGASLAMESIPAGARGLISGLLQQGYAAGYLLASLVFFFLFDRIGWRGLFLVGATPALVAGLLWLGVRESPSFEAGRREAATARRSPLTHVGVGLVALLVALGPALIGGLGKAAMLRWVYLIDAPIAFCALWPFRKHWKIALYAVVLMTAFNLFSHGTQDLYPTFLQKEHRLDTQAVGALTAIMNVGAIIGGVAFGAWSERIGRRRTMVIAALASLAAIPLWAFSHGLAVLAAGAFAMQVMVQGAWGVVPAHLNELSPKDARGAFPGFAYQFGNLLASGVSVWQAQIAEARGDNYGLALALFAGVVAVVIAALAFAGPERRGITLAA
jgi:SHS family lactate transporter-like MFS transporter